MGQQGQQNVQRIMGTAPEPFDGSPDKAISFWNALENYYTLNTAQYPTEENRVAAALTHFKLGTNAGDWASDRLTTALNTTFGTWNVFKEDFKKQFIPVQIQEESIQKMHTTPMGTRPFNEWLLDWTRYARRSGVDDKTKMYAFRKQLNKGIQDKLVLVSPQPNTLDALIAKSRELDNNWRMFAQPRSGFTTTPRRQGTRIRELSTETETVADINATQPRRNSTKKRGKLSPEERAHRVANNLCLYCGKGNHTVANCNVAPKRQFPPKPGSGSRINQLPAIEEEQESPDETGVNALSTNRFASISVEDPEFPTQAPSFP